MDCFRTGIKEYVEKVCRSRKRLFLAGIVFVVLEIMSFLLMYEGRIDKKVMIFTVLSFATALFLVLPRIKNKFASLIPVGLYLLFVPQKIFQRIELPSHDMTVLLEGAQTVNLLIILLLYAILLLVFQSTGKAFGVGGILLLLLSVTNYYVFLFRGTSLNYTDFLAVGTAMTIVKSYDFSVSAELWYSILYFLFFIVSGFWCDFVWERKKWYHIILSGVATLYITAFVLFWGCTDYLEENDLQGVYWTPSANQPLEGFLLSFAINIEDSYVSKPAGYTESALEDIAKRVEETYSPVNLSTDVKRPNIIVIMNESWSDLSVLGNVETDMPYTVDMAELGDNATGGKLSVSVLGGLTANTEFEFLTGDTMAFLPHNSVPYQLQVNHDMYSMARFLKEQGYQTMAIHPSGRAAWNRDKVYQWFGFDEFIVANEFQVEYDYIREYISDDCNFNEVVWRFEHKTPGQPLFMFNVTIQNHGGYQGGADADVSITKVGGLTADELGDITDAETVVNLMKISGDEFLELLEYFEGVEEPTLICMFGDHQPRLSDEFYSAVFENSGMDLQQREERKYITPYVIWANYDVELPEYGDMSANYLGAVLMECANVELSTYYKLLLQIRNEYPVISYHNIADIENTDRIKEYQIFQYNNLIDREYKQKMFSVLSNTP